MLLNTERLIIRELTIDDASFVHELLNSQGFIDNIGDRGIRTVEQAKQTILEKYAPLYPNFGLFAVELKVPKTLVGTVSYLKRPYLDHDDIGYAFLPEYFGQGYAFEASTALIDWAKQQGKTTLYGVVNPDNVASINLLRKLGFCPNGTVVMENETQPILKFEINFI